MGFHLKRYGRALVIYKKWWFLVLPLLGLYLVYAALVDVTYSVSQAFSPFSLDIPVAAANSPRDTLKLKELVANPDLLFLDEFALARLQNKLNLLENNGARGDDKFLQRTAHKDLSLSGADGTGLRLSYTGKDATLGEMLVTYYTARLMTRIQDGMARLKLSPPQAPLAFAPEGEVVVTAEKSLWSPDRLWPATVVLLLSSLGVMVLIGIFELSDPTFKSERQIARYLGLPILGTIPDASPLLKRIPQ